MNAHTTLSIIGTARVYLLCLAVAITQSISMRCVHTVENLLRIEFKRSGIMGKGPAKAYKTHCIAINQLRMLRCNDSGICWLKLYTLATLKRCC